MQVLTQFLKMETLLDDNVGQNVELELERGGIPLTVQLTVSYSNNLVSMLMLAPFCLKV